VSAYVPSGPSKRMSMRVFAPSVVVVHDHDVKSITA
jgi:hypothetical protein